VVTVESCAGEISEPMSVSKEKSAAIRIARTRATKRSTKRS
jgi:hypothetical protein